MSRILFRSSAKLPGFLKFPETKPNHSSFQKTRSLHVGFAPRSAEASTVLPIPKKSFRLRKGMALTTGLVGSVIYCLDAKIKREENLNKKFHDSSLPKAERRAALDELKPTTAEKFQFLEEKLSWHISYNKYEDNKKSEIAFIMETFDLIPGGRQYFLGLWDIEDGLRFNSYNDRALSSPIADWIRSSSEDHEKLALILFKLGKCSEFGHVALTKLNAQSGVVKHARQFAYAKTNVDYLTILLDKKIDDDFDSFQFYAAIFLAVSSETPRMVQDLLAIKPARIDIAELLISKAVRPEKVILSEYSQLISISVLTQALADHPTQAGIRLLFKIREECKTIDHPMIDKALLSILNNPKVSYPICLEILATCKWLPVNSDPTKKDRYQLNFIFDSIVCLDEVAALLEKLDPIYTFEFLSHRAESQIESARNELLKFSLKYPAYLDRTIDIFASIHAIEQLTSIALNQTSSKAVQSLHKIGYSEKPRNKEAHYALKTIAGTTKNIVLKNEAEQALLKITETSKY